ncbi:hypothetical protein [Anabaena sp. UHCC 0399]|uniref:hypothetical protein n=1 Tax=Anabaena sp. UHCC 0399 TaxID=3110238 RepID=UPI002B20247D|nr:hypothetical protein [Anabaena sp. UHCC 0399]MEA5567326.1 hypothetical protein [Anabaena sp. UHCC 0399]
MKEINLNHHKFVLPNLRESDVISTSEVDCESSVAKDANTLIKLNMKDLLDVCGGEGSYQGRRSSGGYVPT